MIANKNRIQGSYISYFSNLVKTYGGINLAQGIPGFQPPARLLDILAEIRDQPVHQYAPGTGNLELLQQLRNRYAGRYIPDTSDFFVVNGATEAISLIYTYLYHRFGKQLNALAFSPAYESYTHLPKIFGNDICYQKLEEDGSVNLQELENTLISKGIKLVFLCSPGNPWGKVTSKENLDAICTLCERNACFLLIDAVYSELYYNERPWYPTGRINEFIFCVNSFSKLFSITGWRIGYFLADQKHMAGLRYIHDYIGLSSPSLLQAAIAAFLRDEAGVESYLSGLRATIAENFNKQGAKLTSHGFSVPGHDGGYFIWCRCPDDLGSGIDFAVDLYNRKQTAVIPGAHFGSEWDSFIRINLAMPEEILEKGIDHICEAADEY